MRLLPILTFVPTACVAVLFSWGTLFVGFLFDEPYRGIGHEIARWTVFACVVAYPVFWFGALVVAILALVRGWPNRVLVSAALVPYAIALLPFLIITAVGAK
jgi:hypothetical protein